MSEKAVRHSERMFPTGLQLFEEKLTVKVQQLLQVPKNHRALAPEVLWHVGPVHLWEIVVYDVPQRADVLLLCRHHLLHNVPQFTSEGQYKQKINNGSGKKLNKRITFLNTVQ